jgi:glycogen(starch) synthase
MNMKILFWTELFSPHIGGIEVFSAQFIKVLLSLEYRVEVVTSHSGARLPDISEKEGIRIHRFPFQKALIRRDIKEIKQISAKVIRMKKHFRPDIIHINTIQPSLFFFYHTRASFPAPFILTLHQPPVDPSTNSSLLHNTMSSANWITTVSHNLLSKARYYAPGIELKSSVIHNGLEWPPIKPSRLSFKNPTLLCIGRLIKDKGFDLAIDALKNVLKYYPGANLIIAGDGPERRYLEEKTLNLGLSNTVRFTGWVPPEEVPGLMNKASIVVVPSRWEEPFCLVALQAAQMARPVVASKTGGIPETVLDKETGLLFEKENIKDLEEKILFLIQNPHVSLKMGKTAKKRAEADFNMERVVKEYDSLYKRLCH